MPFCVHCGEQISYLPFNCKYCGGTFCKKHRLPENHDCSFELKHTSVIPTSSRGERPLYQDTPSARTSYDKKMDKEGRKYLKEQERQRKQFLKGYKTSFSGGGASATPGTIAIIVLIAIFSIMATIFAIFGLAPYIALSVYGLLNGYFWVIITSIFISYSIDFLGLFFLIILLYFLHNIAKNIEIQFGTKFLIQLYLFCAAFTALFYFLLRFLLAPLYPIGPSEYALPVGLATGAVLGLISYLIYFNPEREMTMFCMFIPVKMKGKTLLLLLILFRLIPGLLFSLMGGPVYLIWYLPDLGGIFASYIVFRVKIKRRLV